MRFWCALLFLPEKKKRSRSELDTSRAGVGYHVVIGAFVRERICQLVGMGSV